MENDNGSSSTSPARTSEQQSQVQVCSGPLIAHACRFPPGVDLVPMLRQAAHDSAKVGATSAVCVLSVVGSVSHLVLRMADASNVNKKEPMRSWSEPMEILSLSGTFAVSSTDAVHFHLHMAVSDASGAVFGGHLVSGRVHTTVELVLGSIQSVCFERLPDSITGYRELAVSSKKENDVECTSNSTR